VSAQPFEGGQKNEEPNQRDACRAAIKGAEADFEDATARCRHRLKSAHESFRICEMSVSQPRAAAQRLQIGFAHGREMLDSDGDRPTKGRIARIVSFSLFRAWRRKSVSIVVWHVFNAIESNLAPIVVEFWNRREFVTTYADDHSFHVSNAPLKGWRSRKWQRRRLLSIGEEKQIRL